MSPNIAIAKVDGSAPTLHPPADNHLKDNVNWGDDPQFKPIVFAPQDAE
jgi:hypothetical protein